MSDMPIYNEATYKDDKDLTITALFTLLEAYTGRDMLDWGSYEGARVETILREITSRMNYNISQNEFDDCGE